MFCGNFTSNSNYFHHDRIRLIKLATKNRNLYGFSQEIPHLITQKSHTLPLPSIVIEFMDQTLKDFFILCSQRIVLVTFNSA